MHRFFIFHRAALCAIVMLAGAAGAAAELALPPDSPEYELGTTPDAALGTNEADIGLQPGDTVPAFTINTHDGKSVSLQGLLKQGPLLVVFYRGGWCPYCNVQIRQLTEAWPQFKQRKVTPVLISVDTPDAATLAQKTYEIPFPVLSDPDLKAHTAFDVILDIDDKTYALYKSYGIDLESWSGQKHHKIAVASAFIVDASGTVQWAHTSTDYKTRPSPEQLLAAIDAWRQTSGSATPPR